jgi:cobalt/nickel transport system permease protein
MSPAARLLLTLGFLLGLSAIPASAPGWLALAALALLAAWVGSRLSVKRLLKRLVWLGPLVFGAAALAAFGPGGWRHGLFLLLRASLGLCVLVGFSLTTSFSDTLRVLERWRCPRLLLMTLSLTYRYAGLLREEVRRMDRARRSRTFCRNRLARWKLGASILGLLLVRSLERSQRIHLALMARGWNGRP